MNANPTSTSSFSTLYKWLVIACAIIAGGVIYYATVWGPWAYRDSAAFLEVARNLVNGNGFYTIQASGDFNPWVKQPPIYPLLLAGSGWLGLDIVEAGRWIDILSMFGLVGFIGWGFRKLRIKEVHIVLVLLTVMTAPIILEDYTSLLTEPFYLTASVASILCLALYIRQERYPYFILSSLFMILSTLTRYAGSAILVSAVFALLFLRDNTPLWRRVRDSALFGIINIAPLAIWMLRQFKLSPHEASPFAFNPDIWEALRPFRASLIDITWTWLPATQWFPMPIYRMRFIVIVLLIFVVAGLWFVVFLKNRREGDSSWIETPLFPAMLLVMTAVFHILFLMTVTILGPWEVRIDLRQLSPIFLFGPLGVLILLFHSLEKTLSPGWRRISIFCVFLLFVISSTPIAYQFIQRLHDEGLGYTSAYWQHTEILQEVESLPDDITIISNEPEVITFLLDIRAYRLPELQTGIPAPIDESFGSNPDDSLHIIFRNNEAVLVLFAAAENRLLPIYGDQTEERLTNLVRGLDVQYESWDGGIYWYSADHP